MNNPYSVLEKLGIALPAAPAPAGVYVPCVILKDTAYTSGHLARVNGVPLVGQLGKNMAIERGVQAARQVAIDLIGTLHHALGDLSRIRRIAQVTVLVNSTDAFTEHHVIADGCSNLLGEVFAAAGSHTRCAYGVAQIPLGACLEISLIADIDSR